MIKLLLTIGLTTSMYVMPVFGQVKNIETVTAAQEKFEELLYTVTDVTEKYAIKPVNIRKEPNTESEILGTSLYGTSFEVVLEQDGWSMITTEDGYAYIKSEFLTEDPDKILSPSTYDSIFVNMTEEDYLILAQVVYHESRGECFEGQVAVVETVLNRILSNSFNNTVKTVAYEKGQFSCRKLLYGTIPTQEQYNVIEYVKNNGLTILPSTNYVYFSSCKGNGHSYIKIENHWFSAE